MTARKRLILDLLWMCALAGALAAGFRLWFGLGATTALSDAFPWGLWKILNMVAGVALSTGGFTLGFLVYALGKKRYAPLLKSAILIAFLGYGSSCLALLFDIGLPQRFWHPIVFWNETSFLFEVFWCVLLYFTVGVSLSCLHHSSLGSLFLVTPLRLYSLCYSPILPLVFILSAMGAGLMVVVLARLFSLWVFEPEALEDSAGTEIQRLTGLARIAAWILGLYLLLKLSDLAVRGQFSILLEANLESGLFLLETLLLAVLPILLVAVPRTRYSHAGLAAASLSTVMGLVLNRLDVGIFGYFRDAHAVYFPSPIEWALSIGVIAAALLVFLFCVEHLSVFDHAVGAERVGATPTGDRIPERF
ncbi:MAG: polysulfide reductase NrfD [Acidobacteriota bacterium]